MQGMWDASSSLSRKDALEEGTATHSIILVWRIPRTEEVGGLQFIASQRIEHDWSHLAHMHAKKELSLKTEHRNSAWIPRPPDLSYETEAQDYSIYSLSACHLDFELAKPRYHVNQFLKIKQSLCLTLSLCLSYSLSCMWCMCVCVFLTDSLSLKNPNIDCDTWLAMKRLLLKIWILWKV